MRDPSVPVRAGIYLAWLAIVPASTLYAMYLIARFVPGVPFVLLINVMSLLSIGYISGRFLPGPKWQKILLLLGFPLIAYLFWGGESEPGLEKLNDLILVAIALLVVLGGSAAPSSVRGDPNEPF